MIHGIFFYFKQKTAYEMRISDWSSDVCSSDLLPCTSQLTKVNTHSSDVQAKPSHPSYRGEHSRQRELIAGQTHTHTYSTHYCTYLHRFCAEFKRRKAHNTTRRCVTSPIDSNPRSTPAEACLPAPFLSQNWHGPRWQTTLQNGR